MNRKYFTIIGMFFLAFSMVSMKGMTYEEELRKILANKYEALSLLNKNTPQKLWTASCKDELWSDYQQQKFQIEQEIKRLEEEIENVDVQMGDVCKESEIIKRLHKINNSCKPYKNYQPSAHINLLLSSLQDVKKQIDLSQSNINVHQCLVYINEATDYINWIAHDYKSNLNAIIQSDKHTISPCQFGHYEHPINEYRKMRNSFKEFKETDWTSLVTYLDKNKKNPRFYAKENWEKAILIFSQYNATFDPDLDKIEKKRNEFCEQLQLNPKTFEQIKPRSLAMGYEQFRKKEQLKKDVALLYPDPNSEDRKVLDKNLERLESYADNNGMQTIYQSHQKSLIKLVDDEKVSYSERQRIAAHLAYTATDIQKENEWKAKKQKSAYDNASWVARLKSKLSGGYFSYETAIQNPEYSHNFYGENNKLYNFALKANRE